MIPGTRNYESASLTVAIPEAVPAHMQDHIRELTAISTPPEDCRKGYATKLLREVVMEADAFEKTLLLWVRPYGDMDSDQLQAWYRRFGFEQIQAAPVLMARRPRVTNAQPSMSDLGRMTLERSIKLALN